MRISTLSALSTVSFGALAFGLSSPAFAQAQTPQQPVTPSEAQACAELPTPQERALCLGAQTQEDDTVQEAGELATLPPAEQVERQVEAGDTIVVTGSRIRRNAFTSPDPLTVIDPDVERRGGEVETAEILQTNPVAAGSFQITSVISAGAYVTNGGVGAQTLSLRGLGAERTLVLVNGRRAGPAGTRGAIAGFDLNVMPSALIESVDILKTGASSIYGSDAIAGVVNLLTKRSTDGLELSGFASAPFKGGAENYNVSGAWGRDFGRGHIMIGADYTNRENLRRGQRDWLSCSEEMLFSPEGERRDLIDPRTGRPLCNDLQQNFLILSDIAGVVGNLPSTVIQYNNPGDRLDEFGVAPLPPTSGFDFVTTEPGWYFTNVASQPDSVGVLDEWDPRLLRADLLPSLERYTFWADGSYELTDNIEVVAEFLYNRRQTSTNRVRQLFIDQFTGDTILPQFCSILAGPEHNCFPTDTGDPLNAEFSGEVLLTPIVLVETSNSTDVEYYRGVAGLRGDFGNFYTGDWGWDSYLQYSRSDGDYTDHRIFDDAVDPQEYRTRLCEGTVTRIRGVPCMDIDFTDPRVLAGNFTPEEEAFLFGEETGNTIYEQLTAEASVSGTLLTLPAGNAGIAVGGQWRRDEIDDQPGEISESGNVWGQSTAGRTAGYTETKEAFAEIQVPLIYNTPLIQNLTLSGAARVTNVYAERHDGVSDTSNGNWTYKAGFNWQSTDWLRFRGTYGTSYRAPALFEQFLADLTGFLSQANIDPCVRWGFGLEPGEPLSLLQQRCQALGLDPDYQGAGSSATIFQGGGIGVLEPETSTAKTLSVIFTPDRGLWGGNRFSVAVDYFDIEVEGQIAQLGAFNIVAGCLTSPQYPDDPYCTLFTREMNENSPNFGSIREVRDAYVNVNRQRNRGVDVTARMTQDLGRFGTFSALSQMTWQLEDITELFEGSISDFEGEAGEPTWVGDFKFTWDTGPWSFFWNTNVIGGTSDEQSLRDTRGGEVCLSSALRGGLVCPIYRLEPQFYHSASVTREIADGRYRFTIGVNNVFDTDPPPVSTAFGPISTIGQAPVFGTQYDFLGRRAFVSVRARM